MLPLTPYAILSRCCLLFFFSSFFCSCCSSLGARKVQSNYYYICIIVWFFYSLLCFFLYLKEFSFFNKWISATRSSLPLFVEPHTMTKCNFPCTYICLIFLILSVIQIKMKRNYITIVNMKNPVTINIDIAVG